jgi:hypothetical protein
VGYSSSTHNLSSIITVVRPRSSINIHPRWNRLSLDGDGRRWSVGRGRVVLSNLASCVEAGWNVFLGAVAQVSFHSRALNCRIVANRHFQTRVLRPRLQLPTTTNDLDDLACRCRPWLSIDLASVADLCRVVSVIHIRGLPSPSRSLLILVGRVGHRRMWGLWDGA